MPRRGTDSFLGQVNLPGAGRLLLLEISQCLDPDGDWCGVRREVASVIVREEVENKPP